MNKQVLLVLGFILSTAAVKAQTLSLPYSTNFDDNSQKAGWQEYRAGKPDDDDWTFASLWGCGFVPPSGADCLEHDYDHDPDTLTDDWAISPELDLTKAATLTFKFCIYDIDSAMMPGDAFQVYLLSGNANPSLATKTLLCDFTNTNISFDQKTFKDTSLNVPVTTGAAYIAFRYTCYFDWFQVAFDDVNITKATTSVSNMGTEHTTISVYPNPTSDAINWSIPSTLVKYGTIANIKGQVVATFPLANGKLDIHSLTTGTYLFKAGDLSTQFLKQ